MALTDLLRRRPDLPDGLRPAWWAFLDSAEVLEGGRRTLLGALPAGRVEPAPIAVGTSALRRAVADVRDWLPRWDVEDLADERGACAAALDAAEAHLERVERIAADTDVLDHVLDEVRHLMDRLDAFADAEQAFLRRWRCPERSDDGEGPGRPGGADA
jgi:hypothetical protein